MLFAECEAILHGLVLDTSIWNVKYFNQYRNVRDTCPRLMNNAFTVIFAFDSVVIFELYL